MRLLDRYLLRELLVPFGYCLSGFLIFWISFDLVSELADFQQRQMETLDILQYYVFRAPEFLAIVLPVALLLALLYALTHHARHHELTAIRAAGVSLWRLALPYLALGLGLSGLLFWVNEAWAPRGAAAAEQILNRRKRDALRPEENVTRELAFGNARDQRSWYVGSFNWDTHEMRHPHVVWTLPDGTVKEIYADRAHWENGMWVFSAVRTNVQVLVYPPGQGRMDVNISETNRLEMPDFSESPAVIKSGVKVQKMGQFREALRTELSLREIRDYLRLNPGETSRHALLRTKFHGRFATPLTCLVVVLIALPFGAAPGRRNVFVGVASSLVICFVFFVLSQLGLALGTRGFLPAWLAAWGPNLLFGLGGIWFSWRIR